MVRAKEVGCYQVRSVSSNDHPENQQLKRSMGFAVKPMEQGKPCLEVRFAIEMSDDGKTPGEQECSVCHEGVLAWSNAVLEGVFYILRLG